MNSVLLAAALLVGSPRDELLRHIPDDYGFCAVFTGLPSLVEQIRESPFAAALGKVATGNKDLEELQKASDFARKLLGLEWKELANIVPGHVFAFAYRPGPLGKPQQEEGLFLLRSKDGKALAALVARLNLLQKATLVEAEHKGVKYIRRSEAGRRSFYRVSGPVMLFSDQEPMLRRAIEHEKSLAPDAIPAVVKHLSALGLDRSPVALVLNPRAFDDPLASGVAKEAKTLAACWRGLEAVGLSLELDRDVALSLSFVGRTEKLPLACRKFLAASPRPSALWSAFPEKPLLAVAGRIDLQALYSAICEFMPAASREELEKELDIYIGSVAGKDVVKDLLPGLGPDWGMCLLAPPAGSKEAHPRLLAAIKLAGPDETTDALKAVVEWGEKLAVVNYNKQNKDNRARLRTRGVGRDQLRFVEADKGLPGGIRPAWALRHGHLVFATNPDLVTEFKPGAAPVDTDNILLLKASFAAWRTFVKDQREPLLAELVQRDGLTKDVASARLDATVAALALFDSLELTRHDSRSRVVFTLRLKTTEPFRK